MAGNYEKLAAKMASQSGPINIKPSHRGLLHQNLGVPSGQKIPVGAMQKAANSSNPALAKRAQFAINARSWSH